MNARQTAHELATRILAGDTSAIAPLGSLLMEHAVPETVDALMARESLYRAGVRSRAEAAASGDVTMGDGEMTPGETLACDALSASLWDGEPGMGVYWDVSVDMGSSGKVMP